MTRRCGAGGSAIAMPDSRIAEPIKSKNGIALASDAVSCVGSNPDFAITWAID
jgi:hypothetical protein